METKTIDKLIMFVRQRPGLEFCNYGDVRLYRNEMNEITRDLHDFNELLSLAQRRVDNLEVKLTEYLKRDSGRLTLSEDEGNLQYITGQYFPTEYRPAACRILSTLIWYSYRDEKNANNEDIYKTGDEIRKAVKRWVSRRVAKYYFN